VHGGVGHWIAGALLVVVGAASLVQVRRDDDRAVFDGLTPHRIVAGALLLSLDNLAVGFALGAFGAPLLAAALVFGAVSVSLALFGFEVGRRAALVVHDTESFAGVLLIIVGLGVLTHLL
jgi:putative Mn2+ efflux pump MntP